MNAAIRRCLTGTDVPFALIGSLRDSDGQPLTRADSLQLIPAGHGLVAERPYRAGVGELARHPREPLSVSVSPK
jgi:hypothetical protein